MSVIDGQVAGKWIKGAKLRGSGGSLAAKLVGLGYQQVCGDPEVWGDGITPVCAAHLDGKDWLMSRLIRRLGLLHGWQFGMSYRLQHL